MSTAEPRPPQPQFTLGSDRLDLYLVRTPQGREAALLDRSELDDAERRRAGSFRHPAHALLYTTAHIALRRLLGRQLGVAPRDLRFLREPCPGCGAPHGRPAVAMAGPPLHFSLSHSGGLVLIGVAAVPVGVDVQRLPREETVEVASAALHAGERAELGRRVRGADRTGHFGRLWTRKEAYLKAIGTGLHRSPARDYLGADSAAHPPGWTVLDVACPPTHSAAAVVRGRRPRFVDVHRLDGRWLCTPDTPDAPAIATTISTHGEVTT